MIKISVNILVLTLAAAVTNTYESYIENETPTVTSQTDPTTNSDLQEPTALINPKNETTVTNNQSTPNSTSTPKSETKILKPFFNEVRTCRRSYPNLSNITFRVYLYCFLLESQNNIQNENIPPDFHCNITKDYIQELKGKLPQLSYFREVGELNQKYNSCGHPKSTLSPEPLLETVSSTNYVMFEDNLKLKLGDEWILLEPKIPYMSHIYLGTSKFPILMEESRTLEKGTSLISPSSTQRAFLKKSVQKEKQRDFRSQTTPYSNIYRLLKPSRWEKNHSRASRSVKPSNVSLSTLKIVQRLDNINKYNKSSGMNTALKAVFSPTFYHLHYINFSTNNSEFSGSANDKSFIQRGVDFVRSTFSKIFKKQ